MFVALIASYHASIDLALGPEDPVVVARVESVDRGGRGAPWATIRFTTLDGREIRTETDLLSNPRERADVRVRYDASDPSYYVRDASYGDEWLFSGALIAATLGLLVASVLNFRGRTPAGGAWRAARVRPGRWRQNRSRRLGDWTRD